MDPANITSQEEAVSVYLSALTYDVDNSLVKCRSFIAACRALLVLHPSDWSQSQQRIAFNPQLWAQQLNDAMQWMAGNSTAPASSRVKYVGFREFRD